MNRLVSERIHMVGFNPKRWDDLVRDPQGLWYASDEIWPSIEELFVNPVNLSNEGYAEKRKIVDFFAWRLSSNLITLGSMPPLFIDNRRWTEAHGWEIPIDTIVIHHTSTDPRLSYDQLNAYGLLRLYCPLYMNRPAFKLDGKLQPVSSGHYYGGQQTFVGYHHIVYDVGSVTGMTKQLLDDRCIGFHAGNYEVNCRSIGIAVVGDLTERCPQDHTIAVINKIINNYPGVRTIVGHKEIPRLDGKSTSCPGDTWDRWKELLILPA